MKPLEKLNEFYANQKLEKPNKTRYKDKRDMSVKNNRMKSFKAVLNGIAARGGQDPNKFYDSLLDVEFKMNKS